MKAVKGYCKHVSMNCPAPTPTPTRSPTQSPTSAPTSTPTHKPTMAPTKKGRGLTPVNRHNVGQYGKYFIKSRDVTFGDEIWGPPSGNGPMMYSRGVIFASCLPRLCKTCPRPAAKDVSCWYNHGTKWVRMPGGATVSSAGLAICQYWWINNDHTPVGMTVNFNGMEQFVGFSSQSNMHNHYNTDWHAKYKDGLTDSSCQVCDKSGDVYTRNGVRTTTRDKRTGVGCSNMPCSRQSRVFNRHKNILEFEQEIIPCNSLPNQ